MDENVLPLFIFAVVWLVVAIFYLCSRYRLPKAMIAKYGQPLQHFCALAAWKTLPIRNSRVDVLVYGDFMIVYYRKNEFVLRRGFSAYRMLSAFFTVRLFVHSIIEISQDGKTLQICLNSKNEAIIADFLGISIIKN